MRRATETGSPAKRVEFTRGTSRVAADPLARPMRRRLSPRKVVRPRVASPHTTPLAARALVAPTDESELSSSERSSISTPTQHTNATDDGWLDIDEKPKPDHSQSTSFFSFSPSLGTNFMRRVQETRLRPFKREDAPNDARKDMPKATQKDAPKNTILGVSKETASAPKDIGRSSSRTTSAKPAAAAGPETTSERETTPEPTHGTPKAGAGQSKRSVWADPATPALIAMYVQVGYNAVMVALLLYAISMFYITIRNDVNMKVEEYSVDIVNEIAHCSYEYVRNGCEPSKRVPAIEAACRQWERCMQRVPEEVGRARVSAETFGGIIESFLRPIGVKSMVFLVSVFAGSFLLINSVFASRIGPRFAYADRAPPAQSAPQPPPPAPTPQPQALSFQVPTQPPTPLPGAYSYAQNGYVYTPSHASPRQPILQSSPIQRQFYPY